MTGRLFRNPPQFSTVRSGDEQAVEKRPSAAFPLSFAAQRTSKYASRLRISGALHLSIFEQPSKKDFFNGLQRREGEMGVR
jgi:hypothetical protein